MASDDSTIPPDRLARGLIRAADRAVMATRLGAEGWPYASLVLLATDHDLTPLLLLSDLAEHARALAQDPRLSLLIDGTAGHEDPLTGPRLTLLGHAAPEASHAQRQRYLARHPAAALYAGFADFRFYRVVVERAHLVGGFGRIHWLEAAAVTYDAGQAAALADHEPGILAHMNQDHADALDLMANRLAFAEGSGWRMTGIDPEGIDLRLGGRVARVEFDAPIAEAGQARAALVALTKRARAG
jgi:putative heme iron utilization protein